MNMTNNIILKIRKLYWKTFKRFFLYFANGKETCYILYDLLSEYEVMQTEDMVVDYNYAFTCCGR